MRNRERVCGAFAGHGAASGVAQRTWSENAVRKALKARLDPLRDGVVEDIVSTIAALFSEMEVAEPLMAAMIAGLGRDDFFDPPFPVIVDDVHRGIVLLDHPVALISLSIASTDAIAARKVAARGTGVIGFAGNVSVICFVRAGGAVLRFWDLDDDGDRCVRSPSPHAVGQGDVLVIDGRRRGYTIESCCADMIMLRATVKTGGAALRREFDSQDGVLRALSSNDERASRIQMLLTLLRIEGRRDAAACFVEALADAQHFLRWHAMREFLALDLPMALPHLRRMMEGDPDDAVRIAASATLDAIEAQHPGLREEVLCLA